MPRDIPVGNNKFLICFDKEYRIRDIYFPHVGQENHSNGNPFRIGLFMKGRFLWVDREWQRTLTYEEDTLVTHVELSHPEFPLALTCRDAVDFHENIYVREITVANPGAEKLSLELFFSQDFDLYGNSVGDSAVYDPRSGGVLHYKASRYFLVNGFSRTLDRLSQFAVGNKGTGGKEGTFRDAEDGVLSGNPIAQGSVDSVVSLRIEVEGKSSAYAYYWICAGEDWNEVCRMDGLVKHKHPGSLIKRTADYWELWLKKESPPLDYLPRPVQRLYRRSLLVLRTHLDSEGGIVAGNDSDVIAYNRDTYSYIWPRDAALVANAMDLAGYPMAPQRFYDFAARVIEKEGYLLHKYNPDGTLASSWHPWYDGSGPQLPIQEDETALVLWALWQHFVLYRDIEFITPLYRPLIKNAGDFMTTYRDEETGLPSPSYDLWEERRGILTYTVGAVFGGLTAASLFCSVFGETDKAELYRKAAAEIRDAASKHLWREDLGRFCRMITQKGGSREVDGRCDASLWGLFAFGMYTPDDPRVQSTMDALHQKLWIPSSVGGMARYEEDDYYRVSKELTGNPWFVSTLWYADYLIRKAASLDELEKAEELLEWAVRHALPSGVLAEQIHPLTGEPLSVSPLTWSHGTFVGITQQYMRRMTQLKGITDERSTDWIGKLFPSTCKAIHGLCHVK
jgi:GH15 family glucan-1,4-alpha-glucosidase